MTYLLDSNVIIDSLNSRKDRPRLLAELAGRGILLACCSVNVTEVYMGMRVGEEAKTERLLHSLEFYPVSWEAARLAGDLFRQWQRKGQTLALSDVTIAAVAIANRLPLMTDNLKHFPMPELQILALP
jgi:predicted nucleic acid-binding protein